MSDKEDGKSACSNGPEYNPENSVSNGNAPKGTVSNLSVPNLGLGPNTKVVRMVVDVKINEQAKSEEVPEPEDTRPVAVKTGDEDVDKQSEKDGYWTCRGLMPLL